MKKPILLFLSTILVILAMPLQVIANKEIVVVVNGSQILFFDQEPVIQNNRTLVPVRGVFEEMGFTVIWESETNTATIKDADYEVRVKTDETSFSSNEIVITPDVPQQVINGRLMLPLRAISDSVGATVEWNSDTRVITISYGIKALNNDDETSNNPYYFGTLPDGTTLSIFESRDSIISKLGEPDRIGDKWDAYDKHTGARSEHFIMTQEEWGALPEDVRENTRARDAIDGYHVLFYEKLGTHGYIVINDKNQVVQFAVFTEGFNYLDIKVGQDYPIESTFRALSVDYNGVYERFTRPVISDMPMLYIDYRTDSGIINGVITANILSVESINAQPEEQTVNLIIVSYKRN
jgi:hypothetical protein